MIGKTTKRNHFFFFFKIIHDNLLNKVNVKANGYVTFWGGGRGTGNIRLLSIPMRAKLNISSGFCVCQLLGRGTLTIKQTYKNRYFFHNVAVGT